MKQITILLSLLLMTFTFCISQSINPKLPLTREEYMTISKNQKVTAWILLGIGTCTMGTGIIIMAKNNIYGGEVTDAWYTGALLTAAGGILDVASIPFFISAGSYKRKGMDALTFIKLDAVPPELRNMTGYAVMPTASVKVRL